MPSRGSTSQNRPPVISGILPSATLSSETMGIPGAPPASPATISASAISSASVTGEESDFSATAIFCRYRRMISTPACNASLWANSARAARSFSVMALVFFGHFDSGNTPSTYRDSAAKPFFPGVVCTIISYCPGFEYPHLRI